MKNISNTQRTKFFVSFFTLLTSLIFASIVFLLTSWGIEENTLGFFLLFFVLSVSLWSPFGKYLRPRISSFLVLRKMLTKERLQEIRWWSAMTQKAPLKDAYKDIVNELVARIRIRSKKISLLLYDIKEKRFYLVWPKLNYKRMFISMDMLLSYEMEKNFQKVLSIDELRTLTQTDLSLRARYEKLIGELKNLGAQVFVPLADGSGLDNYVGIILLGKRKSGAAYTADEISYLQRFAVESKTRLAYSMMYAGILEKKKAFEAEVAEKQQALAQVPTRAPYLNRQQKMILGFFGVMFVYWAVINYYGLVNTNWNYAFSAVYSLIPLVGGIFGIIASRLVGAFKTVIGRAIFSISLGSLFWAAGNIMYAYYNFIVYVAVPYPSWADFGFGLAIPLWVYGIINLSIAAGAHVELKEKRGKIIAFLIPALVVAVSYYLLVVIARGGVILSDPTNITKLILDLVYPVGDILIVTLALLVFGLSSKSFLQKYRSSLPFLLFGFVVMFFADFNFSYTTTLGTFYTGNFGDLLFFTAVTLVTLGTLSLPRRLNEYPNALVVPSTKVEKHSYLNKYQKTIIAYFFVMFIYWVVINYYGLVNTTWNYLFSAFIFIPLVGGILGCILSKSVGGLKTVIGRAIFSISLGTFLWGFGNIIWAYYNFIEHIAVPYPSLADLGYGLAMPCWIYGIINLSMAINVRDVLKQRIGKIITFLIFIPSVVISYYLLIAVARSGVLFSNPTDTFKLILDLAYTLGDVVILTLALLVFGLSFMSSVKRYSFSIIFLFIGFITMYIADFNFLYTTTFGTFYVGNFGDLLFMITYTLITIGTLGLPLKLSQYPGTLLVKKNKWGRTGAMHNKLTDFYVYIRIVVVFIYAFFRSSKTEEECHNDVIFA